MRIVDDPTNLIRVRIVVDEVLQGRFGEAAITGQLLSSKDLTALRQIEHDADDTLILDAANRLAKMYSGPKVSYAAEYADTPTGRQLDLLKF